MENRKNRTRLHYRRLLIVSFSDENGLYTPTYSFGALPKLTQVTLRNRMNLELLVSYDQEKKTFSSKGNAQGLSFEEITGILTAGFMAAKRPYRRSWPAVTVGSLDPAQS